MIIVIIAGGAGTRLWPMSTRDNPKQILNVFGNESLLKNSYDRACTVTPEVYILPDKSTSAKAKKQIPALKEDYFIEEPSRRGTANCIIAALAKLGSSHNHDEPIAFIHADHFIRDQKGFAKTFKWGAQLSVNHKKIILVGAEPTGPSVNFGYIKKGNELPENISAFEIASFKEKPDFHTAVKYLNSGRYLWNCGYFIGSINVFIESFKNFAPDLHEKYQKLKAINGNDSKLFTETYNSFNDQTIDVALFEKTNNTLVVQAEFDWMDVGNFENLHDISVKDAEGNYFSGNGINTIGIENSYIRNEEEKPIAIIGLNNVVVINTKDGLLVSRIDVSHRVGEIAKKL